MFQSKENYLESSQDYKRINFAAMIKLMNIMSGKTGRAFDSPMNTIILTIKPLILGLMRKKKQLYPLYTDVFLIESSFLFKGYLSVKKCCTSILQLQFKYSKSDMKITVA